MFKKTLNKMIGKMFPDPPSGFNRYDTSYDCFRAARISRFYSRSERVKFLCGGIRDKVGFWILGQ